MQQVFGAHDAVTMDAPITPHVTFLHKQAPDCTPAYSSHQQSQACPNMLHLVITKGCTFVFHVQYIQHSYMETEFWLSATFWLILVQCAIVWKMKCYRMKVERNILYPAKRRTANWIGHILRRNCLWCFSTFVRPRPDKFFFYKTRARSQQIYS